MTKWALIVLILILFMIGSMMMGVYGQAIVIIMIPEETYDLDAVEEKIAYNVMLESAHIRHYMPGYKIISMHLPSDKEVIITVDNSDGDFTGTIVKMFGAYEEEMRTKITDDKKYRIVHTPMEHID